MDLDSRGWSLARQLVTLQLCVVVTAVAIEAMVAVYRGPQTEASWEQRQILGLVALTEVALLVGIAGSLFVADRVRRQTFDMEPAEIARRYQHHDAMLHAVREGLIITDVDGRIVLANDEAQRLLKLTGDYNGKALRDQVPDADWAATQTAVTDQLEYAAERVLMVSRSEAAVDGMPAGLVTTLRDRTELHQALHVLTEALVVSAELRKQAHEHANHLQIISALIDMREYDEALRLCIKYAQMPQQISDQVISQAADPVLAARLRNLHERARRRGVECQLYGELTECRPDIRDDLADIIGNLGDNAIDAVSARGPGGSVRLTLAHGPDCALLITVADNGDGIPGPVSQIFTPGWSTKGDGRGFGLALVRDKVTRLRGTITAHNDGGAVFAVRIPAGEQE